LTLYRHNFRAVGASFVTVLEEQRGLSAKPPAFGDFYNYFQKITHFRHILIQIFCLKTCPYVTATVQNVFGTSLKPAS